MSTKFAKNMKSKNGVVDVKIEDFWSGEFPHDGYMRMKAALTAIAYPLIDNAKFRNEGGRIVVSFPVEIKLPKELNRKDADFGVSALATF